MGTGTRIMVVALLTALSGLSFFFLPDLLCAQRRGGAISAPQPWAGRYEPPERSQPLSFDNRPFDIKVEQLPRFYAGYEPGLLYDSLKNKEKGGENLAYAIRFTSAERFYDSRTRVVRVYCPLSGIFEKGKENRDLRGFSVKYQPLVDNRYVGTNASGGKVEIEEIKFREYLIAFPNFTEFPLERSLPSSAKKPGDKGNGKDHAGAGQGEASSRDTIAGNIHLTPQEAKQGWDGIHALLVFSPTPPYTAYDSAEERSTADRLRDRLAQYYYIRARLLEIWFYDFETGRVFAKLRPGKVIRPN